MKTLPRYYQQIKTFSFLSMFFAKEIEFPENFIFFNSGRGVLKWLLINQKKILNNKLSVGIPCYACYTLYQSVTESENEAVLLDLDPLGFSFTDKLIKQIKNLDVLIWINYFGFKYNSILKEINERFPNLIIVEDCSHVDLRDLPEGYEKECYSDYSIFSFNFRKPITIGGGGLLILNVSKNTSVNDYLYQSYKALTNEKLSLRKIIKIIIYNYSYNYFIFFVFNNLISRRRRKAFKPEQLPVIYSSMNRTMKKLLFTQYLEKAKKEELEKCTLNYFNNQPGLVDKYCFGSLCYFPVSLDPNTDYTINGYVDKFMLWDNLIESYRFFNIEISQECFPITYNFLSKVIFFPAIFFKTLNNRGIVFPICLK